jgi:hypothetical protein
MMPLMKQGCSKEMEAKTVQDELLTRLHDRRLPESALPAQAQTLSSKNSKSDKGILSLDSAVAVSFFELQSCLIVFWQRRG